MAQFIDKDALIAEIERLNKEHSNKYERDEAALVLDDLEDFIDTLEVKEVIAEQECTCNEAINRIIGGSWNLLCPVNKLGLKTDDKVKVIIEAQKGEYDDIYNRRNI